MVFYSSKLRLLFPLLLKERIHLLTEALIGPKSDEIKTYFCFCALQGFIRIVGLGSRGLDKQNDTLPEWLRGSPAK